MASARPKLDIELIAEKTVVAWLAEAVTVRGVTANIRANRDTIDARGLPAYIVSTELLESTLPPLPQYALVMRIKAQTGTGPIAKDKYEGDPNGDECKRMIGVVRDLLHCRVDDESQVITVQHVVDLNRLADDCIVFYNQGFRETQALPDDEGSNNGLIMEIEAHVYAP